MGRDMLELGTGTLSMPQQLLPVLHIMLVK